MLSWHGVVTGGRVQDWTVCVVMVMGTDLVLPMTLSRQVVHLHFFVDWLDWGQIGCTPRCRRDHVKIEYVPWGRGRVAEVMTLCLHSFQRLRNSNRMFRFAVDLWTGT